VILLSDRHCNSQLHQNGFKLESQIFSLQNQWFSTGRPYFNLIKRPRNNPINEILSLKKSKLVFDSLTVHYFNLDHNNRVE